MATGGMGESVKLAAHWLHSQFKLSSTETNDLILLLQKVQDAELERSQARALLIEKVKKAIVSMGMACRNGLPVCSNANRRGHSAYGFH